MVRRYVPTIGDIVWINFDPVLGHEQGGFRLAVVITGFEANRVLGMLSCIPLATSIKGYPFEVAISSERDSVALCDQVRSVDWKARKVEKKGTVMPDELLEIQEKISALFELPNFD